MEERTRWSHPHTSRELQQMGRGPGVRPASESSIQIDFKYKRKRCRERIALPPTPANLKYAKRLKAVIDHEIATHTFDYAKHFPGSPRRRLFDGTASVRLKEIITLYLDSLTSQLEPETLLKYRKDADVVVAGLKDPPVSEVSRGHFRDWVAGLTISKKRIDNLLTPLRGALNQAVEDGRIKASPLAGFKVRRTRETKEKIDPFTHDEIAKLAKTELGQLWRAWAWTGLRSGEVIGLQWGDVDIKGGRLHIRRAVRVGREKSPKTESGKRSIDLLPAARAAFESFTRREDTDPVFTNPNTGKRWHEDRGLARAFRNACKAAKVRYRYPNQLRHTFASWALSSGENPAWAAKQMGHSDMMMFFNVYAKWMPSLDPGAGSKMSAKAA